MSIIIRLQNLPLSAKSADIRNFFGGLRIPSGGVHILGGEKGDAFIAFNSDEDARLAMRKDGGKVKDSRVRLYLSSHMEMQYEVEKLTKTNISSSPSEKLLDQERRSPDNGLVPARRQYSHSGSPHRYNEWGNNKHRNVNQNRQRSRSPVYDSRSRSPRRRSRSPLKSRSPRRSPSELKAYYQRKRSLSPETSNYSHPLKDIDAKGDTQLYPYDWKNYELNSPNTGPSTSELEAQLERRITEAMEKNSALMLQKNAELQESHIPGLDVSYEKMYVPPVQVAPYPGQSMPSGMVQNDFSSLPPFLNNNVPQYHPAIPPPILPPPPAPHPGMLMSNNEGKVSGGFYITISGLDPLWNFREVQMILKGIYAPQGNIRWEVDDMGYNTGTAFVKLSNRDDFENILRKATYSFNGRRITLSECPDFLSRTYFREHFECVEEGFMHQKQSLCYVLKGLPFACTYDDVVNFYHGFEVADVVIFYGKDGKATGTGYVSFTNLNDFEGAITLNGKKIGHRYIEMLPSTEKEMSEAKRLHPSAHSFTSYSKLLSDRNLPSSRRPLCAIITGLPFFTSFKKLNDVFSQSGFKPDAIHIMLSKKKQCDGRVYIEFTNFRDFDHALELHGNSILGNIVCVKQILYDEMINILDTQKAKHYFDSPVTAELNIPEKVPYLWQPPDDTEEQERVNIKDPFSYSQKNYVKTLRPEKFRRPVIKKTFASNYLTDTIPINKNLDPYVQPNIYIRTGGQNFLAYNNTKSKSFKVNKKSTVKDSREPIKFNVNKQLVINTKTAESFDTAKNTEEKFKLSKLSPAKETVQNSRFKDSKPSASKTKDADLKSRSPKKVLKDTYKEKKDSQDDKHLKSKLKNDSILRKRNERESARNYERRADVFHGNPAQHMSSAPLQNDGKYQDRSHECVVQISNVGVSVGTPDLLDFLHDYAFYKETISRRYTDADEPTGDVRVTFVNREEAELAVRALNGRHLRGMRVNMFIT